MNKLVDSNVDISAQDKAGNNCIHLAVKLNKKPKNTVLDKLLSHPKVKTALKKCLVTENKKWETPFHVAIATGNHAALKVLCRHVQDTEGLNLPSFVHPRRRKHLTPLQLAIKDDNSRVLEALMSYNMGEFSTKEPYLDITK